MLKKRTVLIQLAVIIILRCVSADAGDFTIVKNGNPQCVIVLSPLASPSENLAAEELTAYIQKMSGAELKVRTELPGRRADHQPLVRHESTFSWVLNPEKRHVSVWEKDANDSAPDPATQQGIVIGTPESLSPIPKTIRQKLETCSDDEAFFIKSNGNNIFIIGKTPIAALYGTYTLLETYLGIHWFSPGDIGEYVPKQTTVTLPAIDDFQQPDMRTRISRGVSGPYHRYETAIWGVRNKMQIGSITALRWFEPGACTPERATFLNTALNTSSSKGGHLIFRQTVPNDLFDEHPEYFTLKDGKRICGDRLQRCVSNPDVFKRVAEYGLNWCNENPNNIFTIGAEDSMGTWCECEACQAMGTVNGKFKVTNLFHRFYSRVVDYILERNPDARIDIMFYIDKGTAPDDPMIQYRGKNVRGVYCTCYPHTRCYAHAFTDPSCEMNKLCLTDLKDVLKMCPRIYTLEYTCVANIPYSPIWQTNAKDVQDLAALGVEGYQDAIHAYKWHPRWASLYISAKMHWNTKLNAEKTIDEAYDCYYGAAAAPMKQYQTRRLELWNDAPGHAFYGGSKRMAYCLTVPGAEAELRGLLADAQQLVSADTVEYQRIMADETYLNEFWKKETETLEKRLSADNRIIPQPVTTPITIDGNLSEETWRKAKPAGGFINIKTQQPSIHENTLQLAYDNDNLYIAFVAMNDNAWGPEIANATTRDERAIFGDDHIEIELATPGSDAHFYHLVINTQGVLYDSVMNGSNADKSHDSQVEVKVVKDEDRFIYEMRIPLEPMNGDVSPGKAWGLYTLRSSKNLQPPADKEFCSLDGNYPHKMMEFRQIVFGKETEAKTNDQ